MQLLKRAAGIAALAAGVLLLAVLASPWPSALVIRFAMDRGGERVNARLAARVPAGIIERLDLSYDPADPGARLDVYYPGGTPSGDRPPLTLVWIHGGGFISGSKGQVANYVKILASGGYTVVALDYSLAPAATYPTPLYEVNSALAYLQANATDLHVNPERFVLAGDSAGALTAAQVGNLLTSPPYARRLGITPALTPQKLAGLLLYCGPFDALHAGKGKPGWFGRTVMWAYSGRRDFTNDPLMPTLAVVDHLTSAFPPSFISVGNADPLAPQSQTLADRLSALGVRTDTLFFPPDYAPALAHEYQFDLDLPAARLALARSLEFLASRR